ncbi:MAG: hypothetical protein IKD95_07680 [Bacteroidales bacterium]|nr:hypothetical protein [Bacteroidales bacterium]
MPPVAVSCLTSLLGMPTTTCRILIISSSSASWMALRRGPEAFIGFATTLPRIPSEGVSL